MSRQPKRKPETKIPLPVNSFRLLIKFIIFIIYVLLYCSLSDNASKRTKCKFLSRAEGRGEMLGVDGTKYANDLFTQSLLLLIFPRAQRRL